MPNESILIRAQEPEDIDAIHRLMSMPKVVHGTLQMPYTSLAWRRQHWTTPQNPDQHVGLVAEVGGQVVGQTGLHIRDRRRRHSASLGIAIHDDFQGRGIGTALLTALLEVADNWLNLLRVDLEVHADNATAIALYKKMGFVVEGTHRQTTLRAGEYVDTLTMARLHEVAA